MAGPIKVCGGISNGIKMQLLVTKIGIPVEFGFVPGNENDSVSLKSMPMELPAEIEIFADSAYQL